MLVICSVGYANSSLLTPHFSFLIPYLSLLYLPYTAVIFANLSAKVSSSLSKLSNLHFQFAPTVDGVFILAL